MKETRIQIGKHEFVFTVDKIIKRLPPVKADAKPTGPGRAEVTLFNWFLSHLTSTVQCHAETGLNVNSKNYVKGLVLAIELMANSYNLEYPI